MSEFSKPEEEPAPEPEAAPVAAPPSQDFSDCS